MLRPPLAALAVAFFGLLALSARTAPVTGGVPILDSYPDPWRMIEQGQGRAVETSVIGRFTDEALLADLEHRVMRISIPTEVQTQRGTADPREREDLGLISKLDFQLKVTEKQWHDLIREARANSMNGTFRSTAQLASADYQDQYGTSWHVDLFNRFGVSKEYRATMRASRRAALPDDLTYNAWSNSGAFLIDMKTGGLQAAFTHRAMGDMRKRRDQAARAARAAADKRMREAAGEAARQRQQIGTRHNIDKR